MLIARSVFSCASAWKGNRPRETMRSHRRRGGVVPSDNEGVSFNESKPDSASLRNCQRLTFQRCVKPAIGEEECADALIELTGVVEDRALQKASDMSREIHTGVLSVRVWIEQWSRGKHNLRYSRTWKSEWLVVAMKQGNACGAKGPYFSRVYIKIRRTA